MNLTIIDFDGTIAFTPTRPIDWRGKDWWGSTCSLASPEQGGFWNGRVNLPVIKAFHDASNDENNDTILLTGRRSPIASCVRQILRSHGLFGNRIIDPTKKKEREWFEYLIEQKEDQLDENPSHDQYFVGDIEVSNKIPGTFGHKKEVVERLIKKGNYENLDIWDDRKDHIHLFIETVQQLMKSNLIKKATIHQVFAPFADYVEATHIDIPITEKLFWNTHN